MMDEKLKPIFDTFSDAWRLYRKFANVAYGRYSMEALVRTAGEYVLAHGGTPLANGLASAVKRTLVANAADRFAAEVDVDGYTVTRNLPFV